MQGISQPKCMASLSPIGAGRFSPQMQGVSQPKCRGRAFLSPNAGRFSAQMQGISQPKCRASLSANVWHPSAQMQGISQPNYRASLSPNVVHLSCKHLNLYKKCCQGVSSAMLNGWKVGKLKQPNQPRRHQGCTKEAPRRNQGGANEATGENIVQIYNTGRLLLEK